MGLGGVAPEDICFVLSLFFTRKTPVTTLQVTIMMLLRFEFTKGSNFCPTQTWHVTDISLR